MILSRHLLASRTDGWLLLNPPSPKGCTINREGFGGLGTVVAGSRGFVYPALLLAEAAAELCRRQEPILACDGVLAPRTAAPRRLRKLGEVRGILLRAAAASLAHDLAFLDSVGEPLARAPVVVAGPGLDRLGDVITERLPGARISAGPTGFEAARMLLGERPDPGPPDSWPDADWSALPLLRGRLPLHHGRGCAFACGYCPYVVATGRRHLVRSAARTAEEYRTQAARHRPKRVVFRDPLFGHARESTLELLELLRAEPSRPRVPFEIETRPEALDPGLLGALAAAGCVEIKLGVETVEPAPLVRAGRIADAGAAAEYAAQVERVLEGAARLGMAVRAYLLEGLPESTAEGLARTRELVRGAAFVHVKIVAPHDPLGVFRLAGSTPEVRLSGRGGLS